MPPISHEVFNGLVRRFADLERSGQVPSRLELRRIFIRAVRIIVDAGI